MPRSPSDGGPPLGLAVAAEDIDARLLLPAAAVLLGFDQLRSPELFDDQLRELSIDSQRHLFVVDRRGAVLASPDERQLFRTVPAASDVRSRILGHRPFADGKERVLARRRAPRPRR